MLPSKATNTNATKPTVLAANDAKVLILFCVVVFLVVVLEFLFLFPNSTRHFCLAIGDKDNERAFKQQG